jgi:diguanylate cyclase (GGDEF)-like protein
MLFEVTSVSVGLGLALAGGIGGWLWARGRRPAATLHPAPQAAAETELVSAVATTTGRDDLAMAQRKATIDPLTGAFNRAAFFGEVEEWFAQTPPDGDSALIYIDVDHFKQINDTLGHAVGDALLKRTVVQMRAVCGERALLGRLGGDEFAVFLTGLDSMELAEITASQLCEALKTPCTLCGHGVVPSASVGYAMAPQDAANLEELARAADLALYAAKEAGRRTYRAFEGYMLLEMEQRSALEQMVRHATVKQNFELCFQPIIDARTGRLTTLEALIRLRTPEGRLISPALFIPVAEEIGLISDIGRWVLREACGMAAFWPPHVKLSVNLSPLQFRDYTVADTVRQVLKETGFPSERLQLEVTEGLLLLQSEEILTQLGMLKELGVDLAMDDFGAGYCSLSYLWKFPFDTIKIDRAFVQALDDHEAVATDILRAVVTLAQSLRLGITVEGVETDAQAAFLGRLGCDSLQGYLFSPPLNPADTAAFIAMDLAKGVVQPLAEARARRRHMSAV